jgi:hypothetical protein
MDGLGRSGGGSTDSFLVVGVVPEMAENGDTSGVNGHQSGVLVGIGQVLGQVLHGQLLGSVGDVGVDERSQVEVGLSVEIQVILDKLVGLLSV